MDLLVDYGSDSEADGAILSQRDVIVVAQKHKKRALDTADVHSPKHPRIDPQQKVLAPVTAEKPHEQQTIALPDPMMLLAADVQHVNGSVVGYKGSDVAGCSVAPLSRQHRACHQLDCHHSAGTHPAADQVGSNQAKTTATPASNIQQQPERVRGFPHVEGNFPTVVYVPVPSGCLGQLQQLADVLIRQCPKISAAPLVMPAAEQADTAQDTASTPLINTGNIDHNLLRLWPTWPSSQQQASSTGHIQTSEVESLQQQQQQNKHEHQLQLHMSLSRTVPIKHIQIASLKAALIKQLKPFQKLKVELHGLTCLVNDAGTRSFVCLKVSKGLQQVGRLLAAVDRAFITHGLQTFYEDPIPHVSLAWTPGDQRHLLQHWLQSFPHSAITMQVSSAFCLVGKTTYTIWEP